MTPPRHADLIVGRDTSDDALVWRRPDGRALVATVDMFTPIVDDAYTWGRIAATNAVSDIYAMGATPLFALAICAWPRDVLPLKQLTAVLEGGQQAAAEGGWVVGGGHTIDGPEPVYGQAVIGDVDEAALLTNAGAQVGDALVLTKPLGTGIVATAVKRRDSAAVQPGGELATIYAAAVASMTRNNAAAAAAAGRVAAHAMTDVTGFGLLGHLLPMLRASAVGAQLSAPAIPRFAGLEALIAADAIPGGTRRNLADVAPHVDFGGTDAATQLVLADAQTSGGLLIAVDAADADTLVRQLSDEGHTAAQIGVCTPLPTDGPQVHVVE